MDPCECECEFECRLDCEECGCDGVCDKGPECECVCTCEFIIEYRNLLGGTHSNPEKYTVNDDTIVFERPVRPGYDFLGWQDEQGFFVPGILAGSRGDRIFYAVWSDPIVYTITYIMNGGTNDPANPATYTVTSNTITLQPPTRAGYTFAGWTPVNTIPAGSTGSRTFTANWTALTTTPYTVLYLGTNGVELMRLGLQGTTDMVASAMPFGFPGYTFVAGHASNLLSGIIAADGSLVLILMYDPVAAPAVAIIPPPAPPAVITEDPPEEDPPADEPPALTDIPDPEPPLAAAPDEDPEPDEDDDDDQFVLSIPEQDVPLAAPGGGDGKHWALWNLILSIAGALLAIMIGVRVLIKRRKENDEEDYEGAQAETNGEKQKRSRLLLILAIPFFAIIAIILFIITQDMTRPMIPVDYWTLAHAILFLGGVISYIFAYKKEKDEDSDDEEPAINTTVA